MIVIHLTDCPLGLRGDLTKWLQEIAAGVFVGQVSARIRDNLWERVTTLCQNGRAVLVYNTNNEQRLDFRVHGETWKPIDFDGLKLMLRPSAPSKITSTDKIPAHGFSNAAKLRTAKRVASIACGQTAHFN